MNEQSLEPIFVHADLDAFFAAVEQADNPSLKGKPVIVGARPGQRGVVSTCSYEARAYGIRSAMPISQAYRLCPQGIFLPLRFSRYLEISNQIMDFLKSKVPAFYQVSIDEAFFDLTGTEKILGKSEDFANSLRQTIKQEFRLTITLGIAANRYLAKLASNRAKPDGLLIIKPGKEEEFLDSLKPADLWGVGEKTVAILNKLNIRSMPVLRSFSQPSLKSLLGQACGNFLYKACRGIDPGFFTEDPKNNSLSHETTFEKDCRDLQFIKKTLLMLAHQVFFRLLSENQKAKTVYLKLRLNSFETHTCRKTLNHYVISLEEVYEISLKLLLAKWNQKTPIRLLGVGLSNLSKADELYQPELWSTENERKTRLQKAILSLRNRFKDEVITKARLLKKKDQSSI